MLESTQIYWNLISHLKLTLASGATALGSGKPEQLARQSQSRRKVSDLCALRSLGTLRFDFFLSRKLNQRRPFFFNISRVVPKRFTPSVSTGRSAQTNSQESLSFAAKSIAGHGDHSAFQNCLCYCHRRAVVADVNHGIKAPSGVMQRNPTRRSRASR